MAYRLEKTEVNLREEIIKIIGPYTVYFSVDWLMERVARSEVTHTLAEFEAALYCLITEGRILPADISYVKVDDGGFCKVIGFDLVNKK